MYNLPAFMKCHKKGADPEDIQDIEHIIWYDIPEDYKDFLMNCNGPNIKGSSNNSGRVVYVSWLKHDLTKLDRSESDIFYNKFYIGTMWGTEHILNEVKIFHEYGDQGFQIIPKYYLPISHDNGGCDYIMDVSDGATRGAVYLWPVNINEPWGEGDNSYLGHIADSFSQFLHEKIVEPPEDW